MDQGLGPIDITPKEWWGHNTDRLVTWLGLGDYGIWVVGWLMLLDIVYCAVRFILCELVPMKISAHLRRTTSSEVVDVKF